MLLDYVLQPLLNVIWISVELQSRFIPRVPFAVIAFIIAGFVTSLNMIGIKSSARANKILLAAMCVVITVFLVMGVHFLFDRGGWGGLFAVTPFYTPATFHIRRIWGATSFAALTYIGFDGIRSEEHTSELQSLR